jgi:hypothetical protein
MVCEWPVVYPVCDSPTGNEFLTGECAPGGFVATRRAAPEFEAMAVGFLDSWTRGVFGVCDVTVRPCVVSECDGSWSTPSETSGPQYRHPTRHEMDTRCHRPCSPKM